MSMSVIDVISQGREFHIFIGNGIKAFDTILCLCSLQKTYRNFFTELLQKLLCTLFGFVTHYFNHYPAYNVKQYRLH